MHIPDNYLSPQTCAVMTAVMIPVWAISIRKTGKKFTADQMAGIGTGAAYSFIAMMFNIPIPGGTTGHAVGATLIALVSGPYAACLAVSVALLLQALLFGDGGILAFGANCFNMAFVMPFTGYFFSRLFRKILPFHKNDTVAAAIGSYIGINLAALAAGIEFGIQPLLFRDSAGNPLYCPYGLKVSVPAMMAAHLTIGGLAEAGYTVLVYLFLKKNGTEMIFLMGSEKKDSTREYVKRKSLVPVLLALLMILTPLGLLAEGTAWGEWGDDEIAATGIGYVPEGMKSGIHFKALMPDYSVAGLPDAVGYILSGVIGVSLLIILFKIFSLRRKTGRNH